MAIYKNTLAWFLTNFGMCCAEMDSLSEAEPALEPHPGDLAWADLRRIVCGPRFDGESPLDAGRAGEGRRKVRASRASPFRLSGRDGGRRASSSRPIRRCRITPSCRPGSTRTWAGCWPSPDDRPRRSSSASRRSRSASNPSSTAHRTLASTIPTPSRAAPGRINAPCVARPLGRRRAGANGRNALRPPAARSAKPEQSLAGRRARRPRPQPPRPEQRVRGSAAVARTPGRSVDQARRPMTRGAPTMP